MNASFIIVIQLGKVIQPAGFARPAATGPLRRHSSGGTRSFRQLCEVVVGHPQGRHPL